MIDKYHVSVCGTYCGDCDLLVKECQGCGYVEGKPFWTNEMPSGICPIYECCRNQKQMEHCGLCKDFPCNTFLELRDPNMSDEEFQSSLESRKDALGRRTEIGTDRWLLEVSNR